MKKLLSINNWWFYFVLTFLISWPIWWLGILLLPENLTTITLILGAFGPLAAAIIMIRITADGNSLKNWFRTTFNFRINVIWYLLGGIFLPFLIAGVHHIIYLTFGDKSGLVFSSDWLAYFAFLISTTLLTGGNEEPGWRGYITPVLLDRFHPVVACTITGIGWAVWHAPMAL